MHQIPDGMSCDMEKEQVRTEELRHDTARRSDNTCDGCKWNGKRHQKCSCCRRNRNMKDNYKEETE